MENLGELNSNVINKEEIDLSMKKTNYKEKLKKIKMKMLKLSEDNLFK